MIHVPFDPARLSGEQREWWEKWEARATRAKQELLDAHAAGRDITLNSSIWSSLKTWMFTHVFHGKCAYCEGKVKPQSWGAAEHWRPKGAVSVVENGVESYVVKSTGEKHPGYFWLAYDWHNLVPACDTCNTGTGKGTQFPVGKQHAWMPAEGETSELLDEMEDPLLLHPFHGDDRDPSKHLWFDELGIPHPVAGSTYAQCSIDVFCLDRDDLNDDRRERFNDLESHVARIVATAVLEMGGDKPLDPPIGDRLAPLTTPSRPYSKAGRDFVKRHLPRVIARISP